MAKTLMISNSIYEELKRTKGEKSFSEIIGELLSKKRGSGMDIANYYGILKGDKEYSKIMNGLRKKWGEWTQKYA